MQDLDLQAAKDTHNKRNQALMLVEEEEPSSLEFSAITQEDERGRPSSLH
jgi:hypothetical protein